MTTYASEPGTRLGGRYRLEDRIAAGAGWDAWKAIDETLARAVTVFTLAPNFPRTAEVVTAARAASRLTDPRIAQVFDVEDAWQRPYIVMEWAAGETLGDMLAQGPLEPDRAARIIAEAASAVSAAHAAGVAHMCLSPGSVRWSPTGEVKVVGLGIDAALSGIGAENPVLADLIGLGKLLYAGLTGCWPGPEFPALPSAPVADGQPRSPRQVLAGVPATLSDLACQAMQLRLRGIEPLGSPEQLARALQAAVPPPPVPPAPVPLRRQEPRRQSDLGTETGYWPPGPGRGGPASRGERSGAGEQTGWDSLPDQGRRGVMGQGEERGQRRDWADGRSEGWPEANPGDQMAHWPRDDHRQPGRARPGEGRPGRSEDRGSGTRRAPSGRGRGGGRSPLAAVPPRGLIAAGIGVVVLAALAFAFWPDGGSGPPAKASNPSNSASATAAVALKPVQATGFDPLTSVQNDPGNERSQYARYAIDGDPKTSWQSQWYASPEFGGLKAGSGLLLDFGKPVRASEVTIDLGPAPGAGIELRVGDSDARSAQNLASMRVVASATGATGNMTIHISPSYSGRYLVIWFTRLPPEPGSSKQYMAQVFEVSVRGSA